MDCGTQELTALTAHHPLSQLLKYCTHERQLADGANNLLKADAQDAARKEPKHDHPAIWQRYLPNGPRLKLVHL